jgi:hypothetical protein
VQQHQRACTLLLVPFFFVLCLWWCECCCQQPLHCWTATFGLLPFGSASVLAWTFDVGHLCPSLGNLPACAEVYCFTWHPDFGGTPFANWVLGQDHLARLLVQAVPCCRQCEKMCVVSIAHTVLNPACPCSCAVFLQGLSSICNVILLMPPRFKYSSCCTLYVAASKRDNQCCHVRTGCFIIFHTLMVDYVQRCSGFTVDGWVPTTVSPRWDCLYISRACCTECRKWCRKW